jgi:hypothetical protein
VGKLFASRIFLSCFGSYNNYVFLLSCPSFVFRSISLANALSAVNHTILLPRVSAGFRPLYQFFPLIFIDPISVSCSLSSQLQSPRNSSSEVVSMKRTLVSVEILMCFPVWKKFIIRNMNSFLSCFSLTHIIKCSHLLTSTMKRTSSQYRF